MNWYVVNGMATLLDEKQAEYLGAKRATPEQVEKTKKDFFDFYEREKKFWEPILNQIGKLIKK